MGEKTLLVELEKDKEKIVEKKLAQTRERAERKKAKENPKAEKKYFNAFSSKSFKGEEIVLKAKERQAEIEEVKENSPAPQVASENSQIIEKPNYDFVETLSDTQREKIFKVEKQEEVKPQTKPKRLKVAIISILFAIFGVWGLVNVAQIDNLGSQITQVAKEYYEINLPKYLKNLTTLDATNSSNMENLFQTIPDEDTSPSEILKKSNWFDRFCNFIAGLFGG